MTTKKNAKGAGSGERRLASAPIVCSLEQTCAGGYSGHAQDPAYKGGSESPYGYSVTMVAAEFKPWNKIGGVSDVVTHQTEEYLRRGLQVNLLTYQNSDLATGMKNYGATTKKVGAMTVSAYGNNELVDILEAEATLPAGSKVKVYILENERYINNKMPTYGRGTNNLGENIIAEQRYAFFSKAAAIAIHAGFIDRKDKCVTHLHDHQAALVATFLRDMKDKSVRILTLHNIGYGKRAGAYQGVCERWVTDGVGLKDHYRPDSLEHWHRANLLKAGLNACDAANAVSENYSHEILIEPEAGTLHDTTRNLAGQNRLFGITNDIDGSYGYFRPDLPNDVFTAYKHGDDIRAAKRRCRNDLKRHFKEQGRDAPFDPAKPTLGFVARLGHQKGGLVFQNPSGEGRYRNFVLDQVLTGHEKRFNLLVQADLGPEEDLNEMMADLARKHPKNLIWLNRSMPLIVGGTPVNFEEQAQMVYAASDSILCPSVFEPCGQVQTIGKNMGTPATASRVGGHEDIIRALLNGAKDIDGILTKPDLDSYIGGMRHALDLIEDKIPGWDTMIDNCLTEPRGWKTAVDKYLEMYDWAFKNRR